MLASTESPSDIGHPRHVLQQPQHPILQLIFSNLGPAITGRILPLVYWKPKWTHRCNGWILRIDQFAITEALQI